MPEKMLILGVNLLFSNDAYAISSSSEVGNMVDDNVANQRPGKPWRADTATAEYVRIDAAAEIAIDTAAIIGHDASLSGMVQITITNNSDFTDDGTYQETHDIWPPIYGLGEGGLGQYLGGYVDPAENDAFVAVSPIRLTSQVAGRYIEFRFTDTGHVTGKMTVGAVMAGIGKQYVRNFGYPYDLGEVDPSDHIVTDGGAVIVDEKPNYTKFVITLPAMSKSEALTDMRTMQRLSGRKKAILVVLFPDASVSEIYQTSIYGLVESASLIRHYGTDRASVQLTIRGLI